MGAETIIAWLCGQIIGTAAGVVIATELQAAVPGAMSDFNSLKIPPRDDVEISRKRREAKSRGEHIVP